MNFEEKKQKASLDYANKPGYECMSDREISRCHFLAGWNDCAKELGWQPIKTAPKDSTSIIAFTEDCAEFLVESMRWFDYKNSYGGRWCNWVMTTRNPTHWMLKPKHPSTSDVEVTSKGEKLCPDCNKQPNHCDCGYF